MGYKADKLKKDLITKRCIDNNMSMDEAAKEIGISKATLSRLEKMKLPDVETLGKVCTWLETKPNDYFIRYLIDNDETWEREKESIDKDYNIYLTNKEK